MKTTIIRQWASNLTPSLYRVIYSSLSTRTVQKFYRHLAEGLGDIEREQAEHLKNDYKHRMAVNRTLCIRILISDMIYILLEKDPAKQDGLFQQLYYEISENIVPKRPERHDHRTKGVLVSDYSSTHKRCF